MCMSYYDPRSSAARCLLAVRWESTHSAAQGGEAGVVQKLIGLDEGRDGLAPLCDMDLGDGTEAARGTGEVSNPPRVDAHQAGASGVNGGQVGAHDQDPGSSRRAHDRAVSFHADDAVDDGQVGAD